MVVTPKVQPLAEIMAELEPASSQQTALLNERKAGLGEKYQGQQAGLEAKKANTFNTINEQATGRGMSFSGIPLDEQASYIGEYYLPETAKLKQQENEEGMQISSELADMYSQRFNTAFSARQNQESALNQWNMQEMQNNFSATEAEKDRTFRAGQAAADRALQAKQYEEEEMTPFEAAMSVISPIVQEGYEVTADAFQIARDYYKHAGGDTGQFASEFWKFVPKELQRDDSANGWRAYYYG